MAADQQNQAERGGGERGEIASAAARELAALIRLGRLDRAIARGAREAADQDKEGEREKTKANANKELSVYSGRLAQELKLRNSSPPLKPSLDN